jgi:hypothetical protein
MDPFDLYDFGPRTSGEDVGRHYGVIKPNDDFAGIKGFGIEFLTDPITWLTFGQVTAELKAGNALRAVQKLEKAEVAAAQVAEELAGIPRVRPGSVASRQSSGIADGASTTGQGLGVDASTTAPGGTVRVYRIEGTPNTRVLIGDSGEVAIVSPRKTLFLNFGSRARAEVFLAKRIEQGMAGAVMKSFEVPESFLEELRASAVPESMAKQFPGKPLIADPTKAPDQFGLRSEQIKKLKEEIVQGTGRVGL